MDGYAVRTDDVAGASEASPAVLPLVGEVPLASAALFDLGVYLTVVGAVLSALVTLGRLGQTRAPG